MTLQNLLLVAAEGQKVTVIIDGSEITGSEDALYAWLGHGALNGIVEEVRAEEDVMKIWVEAKEE